MKRRAKRKPEWVTPVEHVSRPELVLRFGPGQPAAASPPSSDDSMARELRDAGNRLIAAALEYEASAALKRRLLAFGYGPEEWRR